MQKLKIRQGDWVIVCDGKKALVLENAGDEKFLNLRTREVHEHPDPKTHELGTDAPGRAFSSVGTERSAMEQALAYAQQRQQFGEPIINFPRVADKIAMMVVEIMIARQLTYFAARQKDSGKRCDLEAGMAKLLAARVAWANADNAVQIHGGNGFALEFPVSRILCDARILSIFEGAAEIQAQVIARRLLATSN